MDFYLLYPFQIKKKSHFHTVYESGYHNIFIRSNLFLRSLQSTTQCCVPRGRPRGQDEDRKCVKLIGLVLTIDWTSGSKALSSAFPSGPEVCSLVIFWHFTWNICPWPRWCGVLGSRTRHKIGQKISRNSGHLLIGKPSLLYLVNSTKQRLIVCILSCDHWLN